MVGSKKRFAAEEINKIGENGRITKVGWAGWEEVIRVFL